MYSFMLIDELLRQITVSKQKLMFSGGAKELKVKYFHKLKC